MAFRPADKYFHITKTSGFFAPIRMTGKRVCSKRSLILLIAELITYYPITRIPETAPIYRERDIGQKGCLPRVFSCHPERSIAQ